MKTFARKRPWRSLQFWHRLTCAMPIVAALLAVPALGQTYGYVPNRTGNTFTFSYNGQAIRMADPCCLPLTIGGETWFFVTGTSDDHRTGNFPIFKSRDLKHWCFHGTAFNYGTTTSNNVAFPANPPGYVVINGRRFENLWSPHLWVNPNGLDTQIHLTFTAAEKDPSTDPPTPRIDLSLMVSSMKLSTFEAGGSFFGDPIWYYYTPDVSQTPIPTAADGGYSRGADWVIPSTIGPYYESAFANEPGKARRLLHGWEHITREDQRTNLADGGFVFFDPLAPEGQKAWLLYNTYQVKIGCGEGAFGLGTDDYDGANSAAFPLVTHWLLNGQDSSPVRRPVELFHRFNNTNPPPPTTCTTIPPSSQYVGAPYNNWYAVPNGPVTGEPTSICNPHWMLTEQFSNLYYRYYFQGWAEGPCAFFWKNAYYVFASRNLYWGSAYMMTYRVVPVSGGSTFASTGLSAPNDRTVNEDVLVASNWLRNYQGQRNASDTRSFGDGEVFEAFGQPYLVFHAKIENSLFPPPAVERRIFFKELTLASDSLHLRRLYDGSTDIVEDLNQFWTRTDITQQLCPIPANPTGDPNDPGSDGG